MRTSPAYGFPSAVILRLVSIYETSPKWTKRLGELKRKLQEPLLRNEID